MGPRGESPRRMSSYSRPLDDRTQGHGRGGAVRLPVPDDADLLAALEAGERDDGAAFSSCIEHLFVGGTRWGRAGRATCRLKALAACELVVRVKGGWALTDEGSARAQDGTLWCPGYWATDEGYVECEAPATTEGRWMPKCAEHAARDFRLHAAEEAGHAKWAEGIARESREGEARLLAQAEALTASPLEAPL